MRQRGRVGRLAREVISLRPGTIIDQPRRDLPPAPELVDPAEKETWDAIMREHDINYAGRMLLEMALTSIGRARTCRDIINRDGELIAGSRGLRRHPLLSIEVRARELARQIFKMLKIELRADGV